MESSGIEQDLEMFPDISPIKDDQLGSDDKGNLGENKIYLWVACGKQ